MFVKNALPNVVSNMGGLDPLPLYATTLLSADVDRMENWIPLNNNKEYTVSLFSFFPHTQARVPVPEQLAVEPGAGAAVATGPPALATSPPATTTPSPP